MSRQAANKAVTGNDIKEKLRLELQKEQENAGFYQEDNPPLTDDYVEPLSSDEQVIMNALDELSTVDGAQVRVYREQKGQPLEYLFSPPFSDDLLTSIFETVQIEYGKGTYRIHARTPAGLLKMNRQINVGEPPKSKQKKLDEPVPVKDNSMMEFMQMQMHVQQQAALQAKTDMMAMFTMMQNSSSEMIKAMAGREQPHNDGLGIKDVLALVPLLTGGKSDATEVLLQGIKLGREFADGGNGGGDGFGDMAKLALGSIGDIVKAGQMQQAQQPQPAPVQQLPQQRQANPVPVQQPVDDTEADLLALGRVLTTGAKREGDPDSYAVMVADMMGDDQALELCSVPENMQLIMQRFPALQAHGDWLESVRLSVIDLLTGETEPDTLEPENEPETVNHVPVIPETANNKPDIVGVTGDNKPTGKRSK